MGKCLKCIIYWTSDKFLLKICWNLRQTRARIYFPLFFLPRLWWRKKIKELSLFVMWMKIRWFLKLQVFVGALTNDSVESYAARNVIVVHNWMTLKFILFYVLQFIIDVTDGKASERERARVREKERATHIYLLENRKINKKKIVEKILSLSGLSL